MNQAGALRVRYPALAVGALVVAGVVFVMIGANHPADPSLGGVNGQSRSRVSGFDEVAFRIRPAPESGQGEARELCALLAESGDQHARGLMGRRDLAGYDGMVFRFDSDQSGPFYMRNVPVPLGVAWFDASGRYVSAADMAPCGDEDDCPHYFSSRPYRFALEVPGGGLDGIGVGPGAELSVGGSCPRR